MITTVAETGSTNADLLAAASVGAPEGQWLRAERQSGGRGRLGRPWDSPAGNLYASTIVRLRPADPMPPTLAFVAAVALEEVATAYAGDSALQLKWPNDLLAGDAKLAGILLERAGDAVVIGFGVNLARSPELPDRPTTSVAEVSGAAPDPAGFLIDLADAFARWLGRWRSDGFAAVRDRWLTRAHPIGSALCATASTGRIEGLFDGLASDGALRLRLADGAIAQIRAGDVFPI